MVKKLVKASGLSRTGDFLYSPGCRPAPSYLHIPTEHLFDATLQFSGLVLKKFSGGNILYGKYQSGPNSYTNVTVF
jgi:hypothetical protein